MAWRLTATLLEFLARATAAGIVAADLFAQPLNRLLQSAMGAAIVVAVRSVHMCMLVIPFSTLQAGNFALVHGCLFSRSRSLDRAPDESRRALE